MISQKINQWLNDQKKKQTLKVSIYNLDKLKKWKFDKIKISHESKRFFKIIAIKVISNFYKKNWDQPIIVQNEVGILGIIKSKKTNKYLLQAKVEPGNINKLQLAPTVQATKSNYSQVHGGNKVPYINLFLKLKKINDYNQSEQGFRYLNKFNSNILLETSHKIKKENEFYWFTKNEIKELILRKNLINMDTISILSSSIKKLQIDQPLNNIKIILNWIKDFDKRFYIRIKIIRLNQMKDWSINLKNINHKMQKHFSIIGVNVEANKREVKKWSQPIIEGKKMGFAGFLKTRFNDTDHYLCRYLIKPGIKKSVIGCTVNTSDFSTYNKNNNLNKVEKDFIDNFFLSKLIKKKIIFDNILSDEGGRFYQCQIRYMVLMIDFKTLKKIPKNYMWLSHNQVVDMIKNKRLDIESRLLFASVNIDHIK